MTWVGYKTHLTETCDAEAPHLIVQVETTVATTQDDAVSPVIQDDLAAQRLLLSVHLVDAGYTTASHLVTSRADHGIDLVGPVAARTGWQAQADTGFDLSRFAIDWQTQTVTCPQGRPSRSWKDDFTRTGKPQIKARFHAADCRVCACRAACTRRKGGPREVTFLPRAEHEALQAARQRQETPAFKEAYALRAGVESTLGQAIRVGDLRHSRYIGLVKTHLQQVIIAVALNVIRIIAWLSEIPRAPTRVSSFAAVMAQT